MRASIRTPMVLAVVLVLLAACAPSVPPQPTQPPAPAAGATVSSSPAVPTPVAKPPASASPTAAVKIKRGGILRSASMFTPVTLDPHLMTAGDVTFNLLYDRLTHLNYNATVNRFDVGPELAASWENTSPTVIVMKLRKDVKYHDGTTFDAASAKWNLDRMLTHPKSTAKTWVQPIASVDVVDDSTIRLNLKQPSASLLVMLTTGGSQSVGFISKATLDQAGDDKFGGSPVGTGPMKFIKWVRDSEITLSKFEGYWRAGADGKPLPYLDGLTARFIPDQAVSLVELRAGNVDITEVDAKDVPMIKSNPELAYFQMDWVAFQRGIGFNTKEGRFTNAKLREAVCRSIDRESMAKVMAPEVGFAAYYFWSPAQVGYSDAVAKLSYDPDKAAQLVKEAGYPNGLDVTLSMVARAVDNRAAELLQAMWGKVGIRVTLDAAEREAWLSKVMRGGSFDMTMFRHSLMVDPDKYTGNFTTGGSANWTNLSDPEIDKGMSEGRSTYDEKARQAAYEKVQRIIQENAYRCTTYLTPYNLTFRNYVKGVKAEWDQGDLDEVWLDK